MGRPWRRAAVGCSAVVLVVAAVVPAASGIAAVTQRSAVPAKLVGQWTRKVAAADPKRTGGTGGIPVGSVWTLTIKKSGGFSLSGVSATWASGELDGNILSAGANRVHIHLEPVSPPNVYKWRVSGRLLTFTKISDAEVDRATVMWGVWKRK